jgi:hypothetical protein
LDFILPLAMWVRTQIPDPQLLCETVNVNCGFLSLKFGMMHLAATEQVLKLLLLKTTDSMD